MSITEAKHQKAQLIEEISNVTMYQRAVQETGVNRDLMPVSNLCKSSLAKAKQKLAEIKLKIQEWEELRKLGMNADF